MNYFYKFKHFPDFIVKKTNYYGINILKIK